MSHFPHNLLPKWSLRGFDLSWLAAILSLMVLGGLLLGLYLPLPPPHMPLASEVYDQHRELVTTFFDENRRPVRLDQVPAFLRQAFLAVEDHRFYEHHGINPGRILKAAWLDLTRRQVIQGASTITQQLAKNAYLDQRRTLLRKIKELYYTLKLELHLSKDQILELYLNQICFGHGAYGLKVASQTYFHRDLDTLNQAEMALLAGLPKGPAFYSPYTHPAAARSRQLEVLQRMRDCNFITAAEFEVYRSQPLRLASTVIKNQPAPYFLDLLQAEVEKIFPKEPGLIYRGGLKIESSLDPVMQSQAERSLRSGLPRLFKDRQQLEQPQGALITVDPSNGQILALVGGTDINRSQFNRATQARRQPGSAFKPLLYAAALSHGYTLASQIDRTPQTYYSGQAQAYRPTDSESQNGPSRLSLRTALASSSNVIAVKLLARLGASTLTKMAAALGIDSPLPHQLSLALGSGEVTPLELTTAYLPLANGGSRVNPTTIKRILDHDNRVIYQAPTRFVTVLNPGVAYLVTQALTGVLQEGGTAANIAGWLPRIAAGKTGTTEANRDAWFIGYTPELLTCVYVGCDHNESPLPGAANRIAAPIWADFMSQALADQPNLDFNIPEEITKVAICKESGAIATVFCPQQSEFFLSGTEPKTFCPIHRFLELEVCRRSHLLPGPDCRHLIKKIFPLGKQPIAECKICGRGRIFFNWLRRLMPLDN